MDKFTGAESDEAGKGAKENVSARDNRAVSVVLSAVCRGGRVSWQERAPAIWRQLRTGAKEDPE